MDYKTEFEKLWQLYPNKRGKYQAYLKYVKARKEGETYERVLVGIIEYIRYCEREKSWYRPKYGSTYFNQRCWLDKIDEGETELDEKDNLGNIML